MKNKHDSRHIVKVGYYHPRNANWNYEIFLIIDLTGARLYRSTFGEEHDIIKKWSIKQSYTQSIGKYDWKQVKVMESVKNYQGANWKQ